MSWTDVGARDRAALLGARLLLVEARIERETEQAEVPITHLICKSLTDRTDLCMASCTGRRTCPGVMRRWVEPMKCAGRIRGRGGQSGCRGAGTSTEGQ
ncbi:hypothetical protein ACFQU7_37245 [Pseudoroseomonas wenyumeiae]